MEVLIFLVTTEHHAMRQKILPWLLSLLAYLATCKSPKNERMSLTF